VILALLASVATGAGVMALLRVRGTSGWAMLGFALFLGAIVLALWSHLLILVPGGMTPVTLLGGAFLLVGLAAWKGDRSVFRLDWRIRSWWAIPIVAAIAFWIVGAFSWHELGYDPEVWYALKWKSIVRTGTIWTPDFCDPARQHVAVRRPLLLPCLAADFVLLDGREDHRWMRVWFALLGAGSLGLLHERIRAHPAWLAVFAWLPVHGRESGCFFAGWADPILGILFLLAMDALRKKERGLAGVALIAAVLLKQDAWGFLLMGGALAVVFLPRPMLLPLMFGAAAAAVWASISRRFPPQPDFLAGQFSAENLMASLPRWPQVLLRYGSELVRLKHWAILWLLVPGVALHRRWTREETWWMASILLPLLAYVAVQATYPLEETRMWVRFQGMRLLEHLAPAAWAWVWLRTADRGATSFAVGVNRFPDEPSRSDQD